MELMSIELGIMSLGIGRLWIWINHGLVSSTSTTYAYYVHGLSCSAGAMTTTNRPIVREKKRQKDTDTAVDLGVNYEDYIVAIAMYSL